MKKQLALCGAALLAGAIMSTAAQAQSSRKLVTGNNYVVGTLSCNTGDGPGPLTNVGRAISCVFSNQVTGRTEAYVGSAASTGMSLGNENTLSWNVVSSTRHPPIGALGGKYTAAEGARLLGVKLSDSSDPLIGGWNDSVALEPTNPDSSSGEIERLNILYQGRTR